MDKVIDKKGELYKSRLQDKKQKISYKKYFVHNGKKYKRYFRLSPPKKGYGRNGIKQPFSKNGALGDRKEKISELLERMM